MDNLSLRRVSTLTANKDGNTKQKGKNKPKQKISSSANKQNGYH